MWLYWLRLTCKYTYVQYEIHIVEVDFCLVKHKKTIFYQSPGQRYCALPRPSVQHNPPTLNFPLSRITVTAAQPVHLWWRHQSPQWRSCCRVREGWTEARSSTGPTRHWLHSLTGAIELDGSQGRAKAEGVSHLLWEHTGGHYHWAWVSFIAQGTQ